MTTRFDAARAHLERTLSRMAPEVEFAVILFGSRAEPLRTTPAFLKATAANRARVVQDLEAIVAGPKDAAHPNGTLRGETNIYEAFAIGLGLGSGRAPPPTRTAPATHPRAIDACADTIYLLTDGIPTRDGFRGATPILEAGGYWMPATPEQEGEREVVVNPETGATRKEKFKIPAQPRTFVPRSKVSGTDLTGPYIFQEPLVEEVRRRNLFIRATIHVVAIGEAGTWLCAELARAGGGRCLRISPGGEKEDL